MIPATAKNVRPKRSGPRCSIRLLVWACRFTAKTSKWSIAQGAVKIDVLYIVHVDVAGYTIDLHFRPAAGS